MISQATLKQDVRQLTAKGVAQLSDADLRVLGWKTAALAGPVAVPKGAGVLAPHLAEAKIHAWREQLILKLGRREKLAQAIEGAGVMLPESIAGQLTDVEADCDRLAELILAAEELGA